MKPTIELIATALFSYLAISCAASHAAVITISESSSVNSFSRDGEGPGYADDMDFCSALSIPAMTDAPNGDGRRGESGRVIADASDRCIEDQDTIDRILAPIEINYIRVAQLF